MNYIFEHIRNSDKKVREELIDSCINQIANFDMKNGYSVLESMTPQQREKYVMETSKVIDYHNIRQLKDLNDAGRDILRPEDRWRLVVDIPYPEMDLDKMIKERNERNRLLADLTGNTHKIGRRELVMRLRHID